MKILLATDGSDSAKAAADFLLRFPFPQQSSITLLTVIDTSVFSDDSLSDLDEDQSQLLRQTRQTIREDGEQLLAAEAARLRHAGWLGSTELRMGDPAEAIIQAAEELQPDLVVLGSHGLMGIKQFLLGSVSDRVRKHVRCSVLIVRPSPTLLLQPEPGKGAQPWRILVAYDDSEPARKAAALCAALPLDEKAEVTVVSVMPVVHMYRQDVRQHLNEIWQQKRHALATALNDAVGALRWSTPHVSSELRESADVAQEILDTATKSGTDLIVLGYKGKTAIKRFLLGSITSRVAHHAPCSVLAVRD
jgi:nucleotide-binding universal stress UspA family protein